MNEVDPFQNDDIDIAPRDDCVVCTQGLIHSHCGICGEPTPLGCDRCIECMNEIVP